jgi:diguanylate cyclase (GGDEF)-like protein
MQKDKYNIGVLIGNTHINQPMELLRGIYKAAEDEPINVTFFLGTQSSYFYQKMLVDENTDNYDYQYNTIYDYAKLANLDAMIIAYGSLGIFLKESRVEFLNRFEGIPYVVLEDEAVEGKGTSIIADNYAGMKAIMEHLITVHGYQKILYLSGPRDNNDAKERKQAYLDLMRIHGLAVTEFQIAYGNYSEHVETQVNALLDANPGAEALVCANDEMAIAGYQVCEKRGLKVGKDIAITGFDDVEMARFMDPTLTTVSQDGYEIGIKAMKKAIQICRGVMPASERLITELRQRQSCGCKDDDSRESGINQHKIGTDYELKLRVNQLTEFQQKSWYGPFLMQNLLLVADQPVQFYKKVVQYLKGMGMKSAYLYVLENSVVHAPEDSWKCPDEIRLAAFFEGKNLQAYEPKERPLVKKGHGFAQLEKPDGGHNYIAFTLFSGERFYGLMFCEISPDEIAYMYLIALLLGNCIRFLEVSMKEHSEKKQLQQKNKLLSFISEKDELTELYNRRGLMEHLMALNQENVGKKAYLIFVDVDHLKEINDCFGHLEGDYAIKTVGSLLRDALGSGGIVGRIGGDEFVGVVLKSPMFERKKIRQQIATASNRHNAHSGKPYYVDLSIGIKDFICTENRDFSKLLNNADSYMYKEKKERRPSVKR